MPTLLYVTALLTAPQPPVQNQQRLAPQVAASLAVSVSGRTATAASSAPSTGVALAAVGVATARRGDSMSRTATPTAIGTSTPIGESLSTAPERATATTDRSAAAPPMGSR